METKIDFTPILNLLDVASSVGRGYVFSETQDALIKAVADARKAFKNDFCVIVPTSEELAKLRKD